MKNLSHIYIIITISFAFLLLLAACSNSEISDVYTTNESINDATNTSSENIDSKADSCSANEADDIRYIEKTNEYQKCDGSYWTPIYIKVYKQSKDSSETKPSKDEGDSTCNNGDKRYLAKDSSYEQCIDGIWKASNEIWVKSPANDTTSSVLNNSEKNYESCDSSQSEEIRFIEKNGEYQICANSKWIPLHIEISKQDSNTNKQDSLQTIVNFSCQNGDKKFHAKDSSYEQCINGLWQELNENWIEVSASEETIPKDKFIPNARFDSAFILQPPKTQNNSEVRCTFDGSEPDSTTEIFSKEKLIDTTTVVRCTEFLNNKPLQKQTETYFIDESIQMPVLSISVAPEYVSDYLDAEPCKPNPCSEAKFWEDVEYPTHVEYFADGSSSKQKDFEIDAGISITGNISRNQQKKSVSVVMRKQYQEGRIEYPLFEARQENSTFKAFNLRNNGNRFISDYIEDAMATSLLEGTNVDYQRSRQVVVFYNGVFYGIYDMREKLNEHFIATNYNLSTKNIDFIKHHSSTEIEAQNGSLSDYTSMLEYVYSTDFTDSTAYATICKKIDIPNFMEYVIAQIYYHNGDWPQNNVRAWKIGNSPWRFIAFDIDHGFDWTWVITGFSQEKNMLDWITLGGPTGRICNTTNDQRCFHNVFTKLIKNPTFKQAFINRASYMYSTRFNGEKVAAKIDAINQTIDYKQVSRDKQMYKRPNYKNSCGTGFDIYGDCMKTWAKTRDKTVRNEFKEFFDLGDDVSISMQLKGNGRLFLDGILMPENNIYNWNVFQDNTLRFRVECDKGTKFNSWEDGSTNPERDILPESEMSYIAECSL